MHSLDDSYDQLVGKIYDCAASPDLWSQTLIDVRDSVGAAYISVALTDASNADSNGVPSFRFMHSPWDVQWLAKLPPLVNDIPHIESLYASEIDSAWLQLDLLTDAEFVETNFYKQWVGPQGLYDTCNIVTVRREKMLGMISAPIFNDRPRYTPEETALMARLSPHIRRSLSIGDMVDKGRLSLTLYQAVLDTLSVAVILLGHAGRIVYANAAAETLFKEATLVTRTAGMILPKRNESRTALNDAIARASKGDQAVGISGIGIPMFNADGAQAAAYVLPIGNSDVRNAVGSGTVAVFITKRAEQQPAQIEILRTVFGLTLAEARTVLHIVQGETTTNIASKLGVSVHTARTHLSNAFAKTNTNGQGNLIALVNSILPPLFL